MLKSSWFLSLYIFQAFVDYYYSMKNSDCKFFHDGADFYHLLGEKIGSGDRWSWRRYWIQAESPSTELSRYTRHIDVLSVSARLHLLWTWNVLISHFQDWQSRISGMLMIEPSYLWLTLLLVSSYNNNLILSKCLWDFIHLKKLLLTGNILNFNVGASVDLDIPRSFWSRLAGTYGNMFYWKEKVILLFSCC